MSHVFISYSKKNKDYARRLADFLYQHGFDVWIDDRIDYGENWQRVMMTAVYDCAAFVVIMTPESEASRWVQREVAWADSRHKPLFPILLSGENWGVFVLTQYVDCRDGSLPDSRFLLKLSERAPSRQVQGRNVTPKPEQEHSPQPLELAEPPAEELPIFDVHAITDFMRLREDKRWVEARALLARIADSDQVPTWFDVQHYIQTTEAGIEHEEAERRRQEWEAAAEREYALLRLLARQESPDRVWAALQAFWQTYEGYDPDGLADKVRPAPPISPEAQRLLDVMLNPQIPPVERAEAGQKLAKLGDPRRGVGLRLDGMPDIDWVEIPAGNFIFGDESEGNGPQTLMLPTFYIARYPITDIQFQAFLDAPGGFERNEWWAGLTAEYRKQTMEEQSFKFNNHPRDSVSWYQAVAFCGWLSAKLGYEVRLPTEQEWEKAARGTDGRQYPWGNEYISGYANVDETEGNAGSHYLEKTSAVGIYPQGASPFGVLDMSGNVWEWCLNEYENPENTGLGGEAWRVLRGGSWVDLVRLARCASRGGFYPDFGHGDRGFRVVGSAPMP